MQSFVNILGRVENLHEDSGKAPVLLQTFLRDRNGGGGGMGWECAGRGGVIKVYRGCGVVHGSRGKEGGLVEEVRRVQL